MIYNSNMADRQVKLQNSEDVRERILQAADARLQQYGYNKTTMAEIASDCTMSAANLYRYFESKLDIGAALAGCCLREEEDKLTAIIAQKETSASDRLEQYILEMLRHTHHHWSTLPRIDEMVGDICKSRPEMVQQHLDCKRKQLKTLINGGNTSGEFHVEFVGAAADAILAATTVFDVPHFMHMRALEEFESLAHSLTALLLKGLCAR